MQRKKTEWNEEEYDDGHATQITDVVVLPRECGEGGEKTRLTGGKKYLKWKVSANGDMKKNQMDILDMNYTISEMKIITEWSQ